MIAMAAILLLMDHQFIVCLYHEQEQDLKNISCCIFISHNELKFIMKNFRSRTGVFILQSVLGPE